jgi:hypothetical protein
MMHNGLHMTIATFLERLGFFTRLLDQAGPCPAVPADDRADRARRTARRRFGVL